MPPPNRMGLMAMCLALLLGVMTPSPAPSAATCPAPHRGPFRVFDGLIYAQKPDLSRQGLRPIHLIDRNIWADESRRTSGPPDPVLVRRALESLPADGAPVVLDIEDLDPGAADPQASAVAINWLNQIRAVFRSADPNRSLGFYGLVPNRDYWRAVEGPDSPRYRAWQRENDRLAPIERGVDANYPSLYTFYEDEAGWVTYATAQICEARRLSSKPVYVFLWPEFHTGSTNAGHFISPSFWRLQLETAYRLADGVVIWGGYDIAESHLRPWDPQAPWWQETMRFMERINRREPGDPPARR